ncbi:hypothetical protein GCM10025868_22750 [Angustibacter aerolatus]|uniref:Uncharacterized protein n=1 Tax=Angustibacter aerolatus TaxID=1162965 RepID=A0ABQ6JJN8_9ACTN|nr:hypothetical protein GCM10025868_22750 [Angustibacter aerolatus]
MARPVAGSCTVKVSPPSGSTHSPPTNAPHTRSLPGASGTTGCTCSSTVIVDLLASQTIAGPR